MEKVRIQRSVAPKNEVKKPPECEPPTLQVPGAACLCCPSTLPSGTRQRTSPPGAGNACGTDPRSNGRSGISASDTPSNSRTAQYPIASLRYRRSRSSGGNSPRPAYQRSRSVAPFELLHGPHDQTMLSPESKPPREVGIR